MPLHLLKKFVTGKHEGEKHKNEQAEEKKAGILQILPNNEVMFQGTFENVATSCFQLKNRSSKPICFKVKTTAPQSYSVRPNTGSIQASCEVKIQVKLQPFNYNHEKKPNHKFLIEYLEVETEPEKAEELKTVFERAKNEHLNMVKLNAVFKKTEKDAASKSRRILLLLEPNKELMFKGPYKDTVTTKLTLFNLTHKSVGFKVQTTVPKYYGVKPNHGVVEPLSLFEITVTLMAGYNEGWKLRKHKLKIQAVCMSPDQRNVDEALKNSTGDDVMESIIMCVHEDPVYSITQDKDLGATASSPDGAAENKIFSDSMSNFPSLEDLAILDDKMAGVVGAISKALQGASNKPLDACQICESRKLDGYCKSCHVDECYNWCHLTCLQTNQEEHTEEQLKTTTYSCPVHEEKT